MILYLSTVEQFKNLQNFLRDHLRARGRTSFGVHPRRVLLAGLNIIQLSFNEMIGGGDGFAFDYAAISPIITPLPTTLPLFASGLVGLGLLGWRRKRKAIAA